MGVRANILKSNPIIYLVFEKNDLYIYLIEQNVYIFLYYCLILLPYLLSVSKVFTNNITILVS